MFTNTDQNLLREQYKNAANLNARMQLHQRFSTNTYGWHRWVFDHLTLPPEAQILELGCGPGTLWHENLDRIPDRWQIMLSDFSPGMLEEARQNLRDSGRNVSFELVDAQAIPFADASFDAVIANHMLYHVPDRTKALSEIRRILRPGGRLYAATNGRNHLRELGELVGKFVPHPPTYNRLSFNLEHGRDELSQWFSPVTLHRYESSLVVTEAEPLVAYVLSGYLKDFLVGEKLRAFTDVVKQQIDHHGAIRITKETGLFEAVREDDQRPRTNDEGPQ